MMLNGRCRRACASVLALMLPFVSAHADGTGNLCSGPVKAAVCAGVLALKALTPATRAERMQSAVMRVDLDTLKRMKEVYPTEFDAPGLLALAAGRYVAHDFPDIPAARQRAMLDFLIEAVGDMASPAIARQIGTTASSDRPEAREILDNLFARGATARDVSFSYADNCRSSADVACATLGLLLVHRRCWTRTRAAIFSWRRTAPMSTAPRRGARPAGPCRTRPKSRATPLPSTC